MIAQISSETVVSLTLSQLIAVLVSLGTLITFLVAATRYVERYRIQLTQNQADISELTRVVKAQQEQIGRLSEQVATFFKMFQSKSKTTPTRRPGDKPNV
ncbi:hypothetical protein DYU11_18475 [Fibrisoma montanum]|uniref:Uncharacterized protein n=1 Tax=Fibrisoma montanum TaxID=2305895 RepID=A0A418M698_9BACT|nr:hypothetical protein [Fibrisoma montanum]RIV21392.1 hypothetical protein DYU11_18475 [Fibrisoma montanum]